jgi:hypothetical protein
MTSMRVTICAALAAATIFAARPAFAGPPLICFPMHIGQAASLPIGPNGWHDLDSNYDTSRVVADTVALLGAETPVIVRMETLRRATLYAATDRKLADALLRKFEERAQAMQPNAALSEFDLGYLVETYKQARFIQGSQVPAIADRDGYGLVSKAYAFRPDPEIAFAAALIAMEPTHKADQPDHLRNAAAGAKTNARLAENLTVHFHAGY